MGRHLPQTAYSRGEPRTSTMPLTDLAPTLHAGAGRQVQEDSRSGGSQVGRAAGNGRHPKVQPAGEARGEHQAV